MQVCETDTVFHALLNPELALIDSIVTNGLRPLSDFPDSERWQQIQQHVPGMFEKLYADIAQPVLKKPYLNSGIFVSPINFRHLPQSVMHNKTRVKIPLSRIDPDYACLTYVIDEERISLPLTPETMAETAVLWTDEMVTKWFAKDNSKIFYYVPQIAVYQPQGIEVFAEDIETFA
jgi:hypothetical protein